MILPERRGTAAASSFTLAQTLWSVQEFFAALQQIGCGVAAQPQDGKKRMGEALPHLRVGLSPKKAGFGLACIGAFIPILGGFGWFLVGDTPPGFSSSYVYGLAFIAIAILLIPAAIWIAQALWARKAVLVIDKNGIFDLRLTERPVPWTALEGVLIYQRAASVYLGLMVNQGLVSASEAYGPPAFWLFRLHRFAGRVRAKVELSINMTLLDASTEAVLSAMQRHKPGLMLHREPYIGQEN
jgi:hypothetical protein